MWLMRLMEDPTEAEAGWVGAGPWVMDGEKG